ncbi:hypothetical protein D3C72_2437330 [compost metagenome]
MPRKLSPDDEKAIRRWCEVQPDLTLKEYQERLHTERGVRSQHHDPQPCSEGDEPHSKNKSLYATEQRTQKVKNAWIRL